MFAMRIVAAAFFTLLAGCSRGTNRPAGPEADAQKGAAVSSQAPRSGVRCPSQDFDVFLKAFANSIEVQKSFTQYPYKTVVDDDAHMDSGPETSELVREQVEFPVMLGDAQLAEHGASMESVEKAPDWYQVFTRSEGSGAYSMTFNFHKREGCWYLTDSVDAST
jgi:hypothetical protein